MITDCDQRTSKLVEREVRQEIAEQYGSVFELVLLKISHERDQVIVQGQFIVREGEVEKRFAMIIPRVDGPLDSFL